MKFIRILIYIQIIALTLLGCNPDKFIINQRAQYTIVGRILSPPESFDQINENSFILNSGEVCLKTTKFTQINFSANINLIKGDSLVIRLKDNPNDILNSNTPVLIISTKGTYILDEDGTQKSYPTMFIEHGKEHYLSIRNVGNRIRISLDCNDIEIESRKPATEYLFFKASEDTDIEFSGLEFHRILKTPSELIFNQ